MTGQVSQAKKLVYRFDEGDASMADILGGKGSNLCEMVRLGLPVPPGFVISTEASRDDFSLGHQVPVGLEESIRENIQFLEKTIGRKFGSADGPLLLSVRSGAKVSMPGMMDTILNLGLNDQIVTGLATMMGDARPAYDAYRRFLQIYGQVVLGAEAEIFEEILSAHKQKAGVTQDHQLSSDQLRAVVEDFKASILSATGTQVPTDPWEQLIAAVQAVFRSWNTPRAIFYRDHQGIDHNLGTAVTIMTMVFGNLGPTSGTGVLFTRNPINGERQVYGEFLPNAQGEDVVAGVRTPQPIAELAAVLPEASKFLMDLARRLEAHYRDVQDVEFTIEDGRLFILQTRSAKRTAVAAVKTAVDMVKEGSISQKEALLRVDPEDVSQLMVPHFKVDIESERVPPTLLAQGSGASPGAASGKVYFDATRAAAAADEGVAVILVRPETKPDDIHGIAAAVGVVTCRGGATSHAAVVTRGLGKPCIVGCEALTVDLERLTLTADGHTVHEGENISIDGTSGKVFFGTLETVRPTLDKLVEATELLSWADQSGVWGFGPTRTPQEMPPKPSPWVRKGSACAALSTCSWTLSGFRLCDKCCSTPESSGTVATENPELTDAPLEAPELPSEVEEFFNALAQVRQLQTDDFTDILRVMCGRPVIIRLLDAPLHEFLPPYESLLADLVELRTKGNSPSELRAKEGVLQLVDSLRETNPMLGTPGMPAGP